MTHKYVKLKLDGILSLIIDKLPINLTFVFIQSVTDLAKTFILHLISINVTASDEEDVNSFEIKEQKKTKTAGSCLTLHTKKTKSMRFSIEKLATEPLNVRIKD